MGNRYIVYAAGSFLFAETSREYIREQLPPHLSSWVLAEYFGQFGVLLENCDKKKEEVETNKEKKN
jgi:hypothetical protein